MPKFVIGEQVETVDHESGTVVAAFPTADESLGYAVDTDAFAALQEKLAFTLTRRGAA